MTDSRAGLRDILVVTDRGCEASDSLFFEHLERRMPGALCIARSGVDALAGRLADARAVIIVRSLMELRHVSACAGRLRVPRYYFLDDNFMRLRDEVGPSTQWLAAYTNDDVRAALEGFDGVLVPTPALEEYFRAHQLHGRLLLYPPVAGPLLDRDARLDDGPLTIAFFGGSHRREAFVEFVFPAIRRMAAERDVRLIAAGLDRDLAHSEARLQVLYEPYDRSYSKALRHVARRGIDLLVHPGSPSVNNVYKNLHVLINAWMLGAVPIFSRLPPYDALVDGELAVLCENSVDGWHRAIAALGRDQDARRALVARLATHCATCCDGRVNQGVIASIQQAHAAPGASLPRRARAAVCLGLGRMSGLVRRGLRRVRRVANGPAVASQGSSS